MSNFYRFGLIGWPVAHSFSPTLHTAALQALDLEGEYELYPVPPLPSGQSELVEVLERLRDGTLDGLNVTIPHKQAVLPWVDKLTPSAQVIGAVNLLYRDGRYLVGDNTDVVGFIGDLEHQFALPEQGEALVLGAGGAARAVVYALAQRGWQVHLTARRLEQAQHLADEFCHLTPAPLAMSYPLIDAARVMATADLDLVVNATPLGMHPFEHATPWTELIPFPPGSLVYDLLYNPLETQFLRQARRQGLPGANGLGMLVHQAALAFLCWTNLPRHTLTIIMQAMDRASQV